jgi:hypothetical protein
MQRAGRLGTSHASTLTAVSGAPAPSLDGANLNAEGAMPKESRAAVQICSADGLYVLASDGSIWRYSEFKDLNYWQPLEPLPDDPPDPGDADGLGQFRYHRRQNYK